MFTLIKNAHIYAPADTGCQDLLLAGRKIVHMAPSIGELPFDCTVIDVSGAKVTTGFIDQHIHITGGGGEGSFATRVPEIQLSQLTTAKAFLPFHRICNIPFFLSKNCIRLQFFGEPYK